MKKHTTIIFLIIALVGCQSKLQVSDFVPAEMAVVNDIVTKSSAPKVDSTDGWYGSNDVNSGFGDYRYCRKNIYVSLQQ